MGKGHFTLKNTIPAKYVESAVPHTHCVWGGGAPFHVENTTPAINLEAADPHTLLGGGGWGWGAPVYIEKYDSSSIHGSSNPTHTVGDWGKGVHQFTLKKKERQPGER